MEKNCTIPVAELRSLDTMTKEEMQELKQATCPQGTGKFNNDGLIVPPNHYGDFVPYSFMNAILEWLDKKGFDYKGLAAKGETATKESIYLEKDELEQYITLRTKFANSCRRVKEHLKDYGISWCFNIEYKDKDGGVIEGEWDEGYASGNYSVPAEYLFKTDEELDELNAKVVREQEERGAEGVTPEEIHDKILKELTKRTKDLVNKK